MEAIAENWLGGETKELMGPFYYFQVICDPWEA